MHTSQLDAILTTLLSIDSGVDSLQSVITNSKKLEAETEVEAKNIIGLATNIYRDVIQSGYSFTNWVEEDAVENILAEAKMLKRNIDQLFIQYDKRNILTNDVAKDITDFMNKLIEYAKELQLFIGRLVRIKNKLIDITEQSAQTLAKINEYNQIINTIKIQRNERRGGFAALLTEEVSQMHTLEQLFDELRISFSTSPRQLGLIENSIRRFDLGKKEYEDVMRNAVLRLLEQFEDMKQKIWKNIYPLEDIIILDGESDVVVSEKLLKRLEKYGNNNTQLSELALQLENLPSYIEHLRNLHLVLKPKKERLINLFGIMELSKDGAVKVIGNLEGTDSTLEQNKDEEYLENIYQDIKEINKKMKTLGTRGINNDYNTAFSTIEKLTQDYKEVRNKVNALLIRRREKKEHIEHLRRIEEIKANVTITGNFESSNVNINSTVSNTTQTVSNTTQNATGQNL
jgi:hypothetical protein